MLEYSATGCTLVFDDCDAVLGTERLYNMLKAAADTRSRRWIGWVSSLNLAQGIPNRFEFCGAIIIISNKPMASITGALQIHLRALLQRLPKVYLPSYTTEQKLDWVRHRATEALKHSGLEANEIAECVRFMAREVKNGDDMTLRTLILVGKFRKTGKADWWALAKDTLCV